MATVKKRNSKFIVRKSKRTGKTVKLYGAPMKKVLEAERAKRRRRLAKTARASSNNVALRVKNRNPLRIGRTWNVTAIVEGDRKGKPYKRREAMGTVRAVTKSGAMKAARSQYGHYGSGLSVKAKRNPVARNRRSSKLEKLLSVAGGDRVAQAYDIVANPKRSSELKDYPVYVDGKLRGQIGAISQKEAKEWVKREWGIKRYNQIRIGKGKVRNPKSTGRNPYLAIINSSKQRKGKRRNSEGGLYETFHGEDVRSISTDPAPDGTPNNVDILGRLDCLYFQKDNERIHENGKTRNYIEFGRDGEERPKLAANSSGTRFYIVGNLTAFSAKGVFGPATRIEYTARKPHIEGHDKPVQYWHKFGEENGIRPILETDHDGLLVLKGGDYRTTADGIIN